MTTDDTEYHAKTLGDLTRHLVDVHHVFTRDELGRLGRLLEQVIAAEGAAHPELPAVRAAFEPLRDEMLPHMQKEEMILFPFIVELESARSRGLPAPRPRFGTVANPIRMMNAEHDSSTRQLGAMREATNGYTPKPGASEAVRALYEGLLALDRDLVLHMHIETNIVFPRATALERG